MKADFEKETKICSKCKKELPIEMFYKDKKTIDGLRSYCKECLRKYTQKYCNKTVNTFKGEFKHKRGSSTIIKRDYELTEEELKKREKARCYNDYGSRVNSHGILIWYDNKLNELDYESYKEILNREYRRQKNCAIRGYIGKVKPSEHFLFVLYLLYDIQYL